MIIGLVGLFYAIKKWRKGIYTLDLILINLSIILPIISAIQANIIFNQPLATGLLSTRGYLNLLIYYFLIKFKDSDNILKGIASYQLMIMGICTILLYGFHIDTNTIISLIPSDENSAYEKEQAVENNLRGARLTLGIGFTWLVMAYWSSKYYRYKYNKDAVYMIICLLFVFFVSKSRVSLLVCFIIMILPFLIDTNNKNRIKSLLFFSIIIIIVLSIPEVSSRYLVVFDLFGERRTTGTGDFSGIARLNEILVAIPYIVQYPLFGVGNVSYHFNGGYAGVLGEYFFLADIGIVGMLFMGGLFYVINYFLLFKYLYKRNGIFSKIISIVYILLPFLGYSPIMANPAYIATIIFLVLYTNNNDYGKYQYH